MKGWQTTTTSTENGGVPFFTLVVIIHGEGPTLVKTAFAWTTVHLRYCGGCGGSYEMPSTDHLLVFDLLLSLSFPVGWIGVVEYRSVQVTIMTGTSSAQQSCTI